MKEPKSGYIGSGRFWGKPDPTNCSPLLIDVHNCFHAGQPFEIKSSPMQYHGSLGMKLLWMSMGTLKMMKILMKMMVKKRMRKPRIGRKSFKLCILQFPSYDVPFYRTSHTCFSHLIILGSIMLCTLSLSLPLSCLFLIPSTNYVGFL